jgi:DNA-binding transcriptional MerR regulator
MTRHFLSIGEAGKLLGISTKTLRHYQRLGLVTGVSRTRAGYRLYDAADILRIGCIRKLQALGLSLNRIKSLLDEVPEASTLEVVLKGMLAETGAELARLRDRHEHIQELLNEGPLTALQRASPRGPLEQARARLVSLHSEVPVSDAMTQLDRTMLGNIEGLQLPEEMEARAATAIKALSVNIEVYGQLAGFLERVAALDDRNEGTSAVEELVRELVASPVGDFLRAQGIGGGSDPLRAMAGEVAVSGVGGAQRRFFELLRNALGESR